MRSYGLRVIVVASASKEKVSRKKLCRFKLQKYRSSLGQAGLYTRSDMRTQVSLLERTPGTQRRVRGANSGVLVFEASCRDLNQQFSSVWTMVRAG